MILTDGRSRILVFGAVRGLVEEGRALLELAGSFGPDVMALAVSREELRALLQGPEVDGSSEMTNYDEAYAGHLSRYGEIAMPPPDLVSACRFALERGIPARSVDLTERAMLEASLRYLRPIDTMRYGMVMRNLAGRRFRATTAREFAVEWDGHILRLRGFRDLERHRERHIAARLLALARRYRRVLAVVEIQRMEGIVAHLVGFEPEG
ncbi:MAG TPA: hypothetical protein EYP43_01050 [Thermoplasmata archaeon]|nr:hypothetical protein [Thermoplasmata archaeon]